MSLTWKSRTFVAATTASLLTAAGVVALASAASGDSASPTSIPTAPAATTSTAALEQSLADLLGQVGGLEAAVAASDTAALPVDDNGGRRPSVGNGAPSSVPGTGSAPAETPAYGDDGDGHGDDGAYDDNGDDSRGNDDGASEDNGGNHDD